MLDFDSCLKDDGFFGVLQRMFDFDSCLGGDIAAARLRQRYISKFLL